MKNLCPVIQHFILRLNSVRVQEGPVTCCSFGEKKELFNNHCRLEHTIELSIKVRKKYFCVCCQIHFLEQNTIGFGQQNCKNHPNEVRKVY